jgi:hypothetical protein
MLTALVMLIGAPLTALATPGAYTVTFSATDAVVNVDGPVAVTSATTADDGTLEFRVVPTMRYTVVSVGATSTTGTPTVTATGKNIYLLSGVEANTTVTITTTLFSTTGGFWSDPNVYDTSWYDNQASPYTISDAADLGGLAYLVNSGTDTFAGDVVSLDDDIDLTGNYWYPIGGVATMVNDVPDTMLRFAGFFDGAGHTIDNLYIPYIKGDSGYGLFGYVDGGTIANISVNGEVNFGTNSVNEAGAIVGYTTGNTYNCHNAAWVYMGTDATMLGGVVGAVDGDKIYVRYCSNTGFVQGRGRVGGVVGAVYCTIAGSTVVDNCFNTGSLTTIGSGTKSFLGGVVGYCRGYLTNSYSYGGKIETRGGHYQGGLVGLLQGVSPQAALANSYSLMAFTYGPAINYDYYLVSEVDDSVTMPIENSLWVNTNLWSGTPHSVINVDQPLPDEGRWGAWSNTGHFGSTADEYDDKDSVHVYSGAYPGPVTEAQTSALAVLNEDSTIAVTDAFLQDTSPSVAHNDGYPYLAWEDTGVDPTPTPPPTPPAPGEDGIYLDGVNGDNTADGLTPATAVKTFDNAKGKLTATRDTIYITDQVTVASNDAWSLGVSQAVERYEGYAGYLVSVENGSTLSLTNIVLDGNNAKITAKLSAINIAGGTLRLGTGAVLENNSTADKGAVATLTSGVLRIEGATIRGNYAAAGGAFYIISGTAEMTSGLVTNNQATTLLLGAQEALGGAFYLSPGAGTTAGMLEISGGTVSANMTVTSIGVGYSYGGAIYVEGNDSVTDTVIITGDGMITGNTALVGTGNVTPVNGGAVYVAAGGEVIMADGTLSNNKAGTKDATGTTANGGAVYIAPDGMFILDGGTISDNVAMGLGNGIYVGDDQLLVFNLTGPVLKTWLTVSDDIYLPAGVAFYIDITLSFNVTTAIPVTVEDPVSDRLIATCVDGGTAAGSCPWLKVESKTLYVYEDGIYIQ